MGLRGLSAPESKILSESALQAPCAGHCLESGIKVGFQSKQPRTESKGTSCFVLCNEPSLIANDHWRMSWDDAAALASNKILP